MSTGKYHHHIGLNTWNGEGAPRPSEGSVGLQSYALIYPNDAALNEAISSIEKLGAKVELREGSYVTEDPSGNRIVLRIG